MLNLRTRLSAVRESWLPRWAQALLAALALVVGVILVRLPILWSAVGLLVAVLVMLTLIDPLFGVGVVLLTGPTKPLTDYFVPELPLDIGQIALIVTLAAWCLHAVRQHKTRIPASPITMPLLIFLGAGALSMLNALSLGFGLKELIKWAQLLVIMWLVIDLAGTRRWRTVLAMILITACLEALIGVWQFGLRGDGPEHFLILGDRFYRAYGTFEQPNPYAGFLGLTLPVSVGLALGALDEWVRPVVASWHERRARGLRPLVTALANSHLPKLACFGLLSGLLFAALIMSWSRGAWLGFGAAALIILFAWPRRAWLGAALVIGGLAVGWLALESGILPAALTDRLTGFSESVQTFDVRGADITPANYAVLERLAHWQAAEEMARYNFLTGIGIGNYEPVYPGYALINWPQALGHAHNFYLNTMAEMGIIGLAAYALLWIGVYWQTWRVTRMVGRWPRAVAVGLMGTWTHLAVHSFIDKLYVANLHLHIGALLGLLSIFITLREKKVPAIDPIN